MVGSLDTAIELVHLSDVELDILTGMERPNRIIRKKSTIVLVHLSTHVAQIIICLA